LQLQLQEALRPGAFSHQGNCSSEYRVSAAAPTIYICVEAAAFLDFGPGSQQYEEKFEEPRYWWGWLALPRNIQQLWTDLHYVVHLETKQT
jgi:hypothetical protein